nr:acyl-ACP thioesterase domain-containing protein [uncultured Blautia sp.]
MSYRFEGRIRYSEIGEDKCLTLPAILDYFQDCCTFQAEEIGQGVEVVEERKRAWVLASWQVVIDRYPAYGGTVAAITMPYAFKGFTGMRNFVLEGENGERLAYANSCWININTDTGLPARLTEEDCRGYVLDTPLEMDRASRKIQLPEGMEAQEPFTVQKHNLDTHHHVNNCQYIRIASDYLPEDFKIYQMRAEYKKQAVLGDVFYPRVHTEPGKVVVALETNEGEPYAVVEFQEG